MHVIRIILQVKPEARDAFTEIARSEYEQVPKNFEGCERYAFWDSIVNPGEVLLYEEWKSAEDFDHYRNSDYFKEIGQKLFPLLAGKPDAAYYQAEKANANA